MNEITIPKTEYDSLIETKSKAQGLQEKVTNLEGEVSKLTEESKNKGIAIDEARTKLEEYKKTAKSELDSEKEKNTKLIEKLGLQEGDDPLKFIETLSEKANKFNTLEEAQKKERSERIDGYKALLGEEFLKEKASMFEGMDDEKSEILFKEFVELKGLKGKEPIKVDVHKDGKSPDGKTSNFDKLYQSGASSKDLIASME